MTYSSKGRGLVVEASDYNSLADRVRRVYNNTFIAVSDPVENDPSYGYFGEGITIKTQVNSMEDITGEDWRNLVTAIVSCQRHQDDFIGTSLEYLIDGTDGNGEIDKGKFITYFGDIETACNEILAQRFSIKIDSVKNILNLTIDERTAPWAGEITGIRGGRIEHHCFLEFGSYNNFRRFFNVGGILVFSGANDNPPNPGNPDELSTQWMNGLSGMGAVNFKHDGVFNDGTDQSILYPPAGFRSLSPFALNASTDTKIFEYDVVRSGDGSYSGLYAAELALIKARIDTTNGYGILFVITYSSNPGGVVAEAVEGTISSVVDARMIDPDPDPDVPPVEPAIMPTYSKWRSLANQEFDPLE